MAVSQALSDAVVEADRLRIENAKLREALRLIDEAIDDEYDVDDGIPNFSERIVEAWEICRAVRKAGAPC